MTANGRWAAVVAALCFAVGFLTDYRWLLVIAALVLLALAIAAVFVTWRPSLVAHQQVAPPVVGSGESAAAKISVTNTGKRRSAPILAADWIAGRKYSVALPAVGPGETHVSTLPLPTDRRGHFEVGPLEIERVDPFGFFRAATHRGSTSSLVVYPAVHPMSPLPTGHRREFEGAAAEQPHEGGISFHSLRDYELGDDLRLVHWRSVAKTGTLMVRKNIITSEPRLMIVLDTWSGAYSGDSFEDAVRIAASLVQAGCNSHYPVMFRTTGGFSADAAASGEGRVAIMRILAGVQPSESDPGLNGVIRFAEGAEGVSLGAITGQPPVERTAGVTRVRPRFDMVTVVQVGETFDRPAMRIPGAVTLNGVDSAEVAARWKARFG